jgi:hypothetical protein
LAPELQRTLDLVRQAPATAAVLAQAEACTHSAMCMRLERLRALELVVRERLNGRMWQYSIVKETA